MQGFMQGVAGALVHHVRAYLKFILRTFQSDKLNDDYSMIRFSDSPMIR